MTTAGKCLRKAKLGDIARVCFEPDGWDISNRVKWSPSARETDNQFNFEIIDFSDGFPVIGTLRSDRTLYGLSLNRGAYDSRYSQTFVLYESDIKTVKILKTGQ